MTLFNALTRTYMALNTAKKFFGHTKFLPRRKRILLDPLNRNLKTGDISQAISSLKGGKTPGRDAIPIEIYKKI